MQTQDAQIRGAQIISEVQLSYALASRATSSVEAFGDVMDVRYKDMVNSDSRRLELNLLYGQSDTGLATIAASSETASTATTITYPIVRASWAGGMWAGLKNSTVNFYEASAGTIISSSDDAIFTVTSVDSAARAVVFTGTATGITAVKASSEALYVFFAGANTVEATGLDAINTNTSTLFNIDASVYDLWQSNVHTVGGQLNQAKVQEAVAQAVDRGLDRDVTLILNPRTWTDLNNDQAALRAYDSSYKGKQAETGFESLLYHSQNGKIEVVPHRFVKEGDAFFYVPEDIMRVGSTDFEFKLPGMSDSEIWFHDTTTASFKFRSYSDQALFIEKPAQCGKITGFVTSGS